MKANTRTRENCWRRACTSSRVKWLKPATEPDTSHSTTSSGRAGRGLPAPRRSARRRSTSTCAASCADRSARARLRRRRAASRVASVRASGATTRRIWRSCSPEARRNSTFSASCGMPYIWTWSRPSCSAVRRLVSASTILRSCAIRWAASALAICSWVGVGSSPYGREQPGQQLALQFVQRHRLERLIRRERRPAAGVVLAVGLDDLRDHRRQPLVHVGELGVVGEQVQQHLPHRLDVVGRQAAVRRPGGLVVGRPPPARPTPRETTGRTWRRRSRGGRAGAAPRRRCPRAAPRGRPGRAPPSPGRRRPSPTDRPRCPAPRSASTNSTR